MAYQQIINYDTAASLNFDVTKVEVASSTLRLLDLGGGTYSTANPIVTSQEQVSISSITAFAESATKPSNTEIYYQLVLNAVPYWWNSVTATWQVSSGLFAQANTASVINTNVSTLFSNLNLLVPQYLTLNVFLSTTSTSARPVLTSNTISYTWANANPPVISQCLLFGYLSDLLGANPIPTSAQPISLLVSCDHAFFHGSRMVLPFTKTAIFDNTGYCQMSVIETTTPGIKLNFSLTYYDGTSITTVKLFNAIIPNQANSSIANIAQVFPVNFG